MKEAISGLFLLLLVSEVVISSPSDTEFAVSNVETSSDFASAEQVASPSFDLINQFIVRIQKIDGLNEGVVGTRQNIGRPGSFWTIGSPCSEDLDFGVNGGDIAIIAPIKPFLDQILNISPFDTFIAGKIDLNQKSDVHLFVPSSFEDSKLDGIAPSPVSIHRYSVGVSVHQAVQEFMRNSYPDKTLSFEEHAVFGEAAIDARGKNINSFDEFKLLMDNYSYMSFGWTHSPVGSDIYIKMSALSSFFEGEQNIFLFPIYQLQGRQFLEWFNVHKIRLSSELNAAFEELVFNASPFLESNIDRNKITYLKFREKSLEERLEAINDVLVTQCDISSSEIITIDWLLPYQDLLNFLAFTATRSRLKKYQLEVDHGMKQVIESSVWSCDDKEVESYYKELLSQYAASL